MNTADIQKALTAAKQHLLDQRTPQGYWQGILSSSALPTATAICALYSASPHLHKDLIENALNWLTQNQNTDGGFGDTPDSPSNISTTMLCFAAFTITEDHHHPATIENIQQWLTARAGSLQPEDLIAAINKKYGKDRTFAVPILSTCALAGCFGNDENIWPSIYPLPFELAACPHRVFKILRLHVVSYALPALISLGQLHFHKNKPPNPVSRVLRCLTKRRTLNILEHIQPQNGGFLEAAPLTSFVVIALANSDQRQNIVTQKGVDFLTASARPDGSWPIDTNLATWLTTLSINALDPTSDLTQTDTQTLTKFLLDQQYTSEHPYTHAAPGGWAWNNLPGAVPDADDTAGALIALSALMPDQLNVADAAANGIQWLIDLQNSDGGIPTFCRGWTNLPFDRSCPDITAHALAAWTTWYPSLDSNLQKKLQRVIERAVAYLAKSQNHDGSWTPLWFGNQFAQDHQNPVYGTARVLSAIASVPTEFLAGIANGLPRAVNFLTNAQNSDHGWGNATPQNSSIEETALAIDALAAISLRRLKDPEFAKLVPLHNDHISQAASWLIEKLTQAPSVVPTPIGLYFASLWYHEKLYPWIFAVSALNKISQLDKAIKGSM